jgi:hypothetical protein
MAASNLEQRVAALETELARLKAKVDSPSGEAAPWWEKVWGAFAGDPDFVEAMRLGRKYRESQRPKPRKRRNNQ